MNGQRPRLFMPALVGGTVAGVLSGIPFLNCLCCLWIIGGAALAAYLLVKDSPVALTSGDGALVGAFAGIVAAVVDSLLAIPFRSMNMAFTKRIFERLGEYLNEIPSQWNDWINRGTGPISIAWFFVSLLISAAIFAAFGALGGVLGMALFGKKTPPTAHGAPGPPQASPPPPPQS